LTLEHAATDLHVVPLIGSGAGPATCEAFVADLLHGNMQWSIFVSGSRFGDGVGFLPLARAARSISFTALRMPLSGDLP
jgi:hypothetical protein